MLDVADVLRAAAEAAPNQDSATVVGKLARDLSDALDAPNAVKWWESRLKGGIGGGNVNGRWGYVFEVEQAGRLARAGKLDDVERLFTGVVVGGEIRTVQVDMFAKAEDGLLVLTDAKSGAKIGADASNRAQLEAQAAAVSQNAVEHGLKREIHWVVEGQVTGPMDQFAADIYGNYDVLVKFFDRNGNQINNFFPE